VAIADSWLCWLCWLWLIGCAPSLQPPLTLSENANSATDNNANESAIGAAVDNPDNASTPSTQPQTNVSKTKKRRSKSASVSTCDGSNVIQPNPGCCMSWFTCFTCCVPFFCLLTKQFLIILLLKLASFHSMVVDIGSDIYLAYKLFVSKAFCTNETITTASPSSEPFSQAPMNGSFSIEDFGKIKLELYLPTISIII
jgi:hypothetical protein